MKFIVQCRLRPYWYYLDQKGGNSTDSFQMQSMKNYFQIQSNALPVLRYIAMWLLFKGNLVPFSKGYGRSIKLFHVEGDKLETDKFLSQQAVKSVG